MTKLLDYFDVPVLHFIAIAITFTDIENAFKGTKLKAVVTDVYVVPDYQKYLENCIDEKFGKCHKELNTQLQWKFEAIPNSLALIESASSKAF